MVNDRVNLRIQVKEEETAKLEEESGRERQRERR